MPENSNQQFNTDFETIKNESRVIYYKSRGPGGQRKNKRETAVRLRHIPSGLIVTATERRFQSQNLELALRRLQKRLIRLNKKPRPRIPTSLPLSVREEILRRKKLRSDKKRLRKRVEIPREY